MKRRLAVLIALSLPATAWATIPHGGGTVDLATQSDANLKPAAGENLRGHASAVGDVSGDRLGDAAVVVYGAPRATVRVVHGGTGLAGEQPLTGVSGLSISSASRGLTTVAGAGDVNGDGIGDLVIGSCDLLAASDGAPTGGAGGAWVVYGRAGTAAVDVDAAGFGGFKINGTGSECLGRSVAAAGNVNGDGFADVIVGNNLSAGRAIVVFGKSDQNVVTTAPLGSAGFEMVGPSGAFAGTHVAGLGDVNGDGVGDVAVGAKRFSGDFEQGGAVFVVHGRAAGTTVTLADISGADTGGFRIDGQGAGAFAGAVASAGDVNNDGKADLVVGAPGPHVPGVVGVVFGRAESSRLSLGGLDTAGYRFTTGRAADELGFEVRGGFDVNADGVPDVVAGAPGSNHGLNPEQVAAGKAYVLYGRPGGGSPIAVESLGAAGVMILGPRGFVQGQTSPSEIGDEGQIGFGDVSADGGADVLLGVRSGSVSGSADPGRVYILKSAGAGGGGAGGGTDPGGADPGGADPGGTDPGGADPGGTTPVGTTPGGVEPQITRARLVPRKFRVGKRPTAISSAKRRRTPFGTKVRFTLSEPATVSFRFTCVRPRGSRNKKACKKLAKKNTIVRRVPTAGATIFSFTGRIAKRPLPTGRFKLTMVAQDADELTSAPVTLRFRIVRR